MDDNTLFVPTNHLPGHIVLYLSHEDFPKGKENLPETLLWFEYYGLEIKFVEDNIRSHKNIII